jgi:hypothetical protein
MIHQVTVERIWGGSGFVFCWGGGFDGIMMASLSSMPTQNKSRVQPPSVKIVA